MMIIKYVKEVDFVARVLEMVHPKRHKNGLPYDIQVRLYIATLGLTWILNAGYPLIVQSIYITISGFKCKVLPLYYTGIWHRNYQQKSDDQEG